MRLSTMSIKLVLYLAFQLSENIIYMIQKLLAHYCTMLTINEYQELGNQRPIVGELFFWLLVGAVSLMYCVALPVEKV